MKHSSRHHAKQERPCLHVHTVLRRRKGYLCSGVILSSARENTNEEGIQAVRMLARNMTYYLRCIEAGREKGIVPLGQEQVTFTNFIR